MPSFVRTASVVAALALFSSAAHAAFQIEEATIPGIQSAIKAGQITCKGVVEAYIARAKAYNGVCTALVTKDGTPVQSRPGTVRAGAALPPAELFFGCRHARLDFLDALRVTLTPR